MKNKLIKIAIIGKTNAGKSTFINKVVGEIVSITNKKINTTEENIIGIKNTDNTQIIFYDTPGANFLKLKKTYKKDYQSKIWNSIDTSDLILYILDTLKYDFKEISLDLLKFNEAKKKIIVVFNKIDLINIDQILPKIKELDNLKIVNSFFNISAKFNKGIKVLINYLEENSYKSEWLYQNNELTNKDDIFISNECTRNSVLKFMHKEIPYNISVINTDFKLLKNKEIKIKQIIEIENLRYKPILLGKKGSLIKKIREDSQKEISKILKSRIHLYINIVKK